MATTATKPDLEIQPKKVATGNRFIIWNPRLDPTVEAAPQRSTPVRPFVLPYIDSIAFALTQVAPGGAVTPAFKKLTLQPGLNEVPCTEWEAAIEAGLKYAQPKPTIKAEYTTEERLSLSSQHGLNPLQEQIDAGSIIAPALTTDTPLGTIGDYATTAISQIVATVTDILTLQSWLTGIAQGAIVCAEKAKVERILKDSIQKLEGLR